MAVLIVSTHDGNTPKPYIVNKLVGQKGYGLATYSNRILLSNGKLGWKYTQLVYDKQIAAFKSRKYAREQGEYLLGNDVVGTHKDTHIWYN